MFNFEATREIEVYSLGRFHTVTIDEKYFEEVNKHSWSFVGKVNVGYQVRRKGQRTTVYLKDLIYRLAHPDDDRIDDPEYRVDFYDGSNFNLVEDNLYLHKNRDNAHNYYVAQNKDYYYY